MLDDVKMFWKFNLLTSSHIDTQLDKENVTLTELMDEEDILQECKAQNRKLVDFLVRPENMEEMVKLITEEPSTDMEEKVRFKYPNTACELLTSDVTEINEKLAGEEELVDKLYAFLEGEKPLNPLLASFFSKVMGLLITRKSEMIFAYLKAKNDFVGSLLYHIGTSAVMDLLLRLITCIESPETRRAVIEWLNEEKIVEKLVDSIVINKDEDIHCNAAQSLCDIVRLGREQFTQHQGTTDPDPLLVTMELEESVARLLSNMFDSEKNESVLVNGLCVIHTLLEVRRQGPELTEQLPNGDTDRITQGINNVIAAIVPRLKDFHDLLVNPPKQRYSMMPTSVGCLEPPLGNTRLQVAKLITALVGANMHQVNKELASLGTIQTLLDLYFKYEWNNFLHTQVEQCLLIILNNGPIEIDGKHEHPLLTKLFADYSLVQRLLSEWEENEQRQNAPSGRRRGFMGHLTKIANSISGLVEKGDSPSLIKDQFNGLSEDCREKWEAFVLGTLTDINKKNTIELMRGNPLASSSEDDETDFRDIPFPQDTAIQQAFSDYQLQQMTSNFIDQFGFNDDEFAEQDEKIEASFTDRISSIDADIQVNDSSNQPSAILFEQVCNERLQQFENDDSDEDIWEEKPITFDKNAQHARSERLQGETARCNSSDEDSTDSGEELDSPVHIAQQPAEGMDTSENPWAADSSSQSEAIAMDTTSVPWEKMGAAAGPASTTDQVGWADFSKAPLQADSQNWADFSCFSDIQSSNTQGVRSSSPVEMDTTEGSRGSAYVVSSNDKRNQEGKEDLLGSPISVKVTLPGSPVSRSSDLEGDESSPQPDSTSPSFQQTSSPAAAAAGAAAASMDDHQSSPDSSPPPLPHPSASSVPPESSSDSLVSSTSSESVKLILEAEGMQSTEVSTPSSSVTSKGSLLGSSVDGGTPTCVTITSSTTTPAQVPQSSSPAAVSSFQDNQSISHDDEEEDDEDLGANFNFLAASGLLKTSPVAAACPSSRPPPEVQGNGPVATPPSPPPAAVPPTSLSPAPLARTDLDSGDQEPDTTECALSPAQKLEQARAQAREAQEMYDVATTVLHNGPV